MKKSGYVMTAVILASMGFADVAQAESLQEALSTAYINNPALQARRARLRAVDEQVPQALSGWRPTVRLQAEAGRERFSTNLSTAGGGEQYRNPATYAVSVNQPLYSGGRTVASTDQAENNVLSERASLLSAEQQVLFDVASSYVNVVRDQAVVELNVGSQQVLRRQLEAAQDRFRVGEVTRTDVAQAEARVAGATADVQLAESNLQASRAAYQNVVGTAPGRLASPGAIPVEPKSLAEAVALALQTNPNVVAAEFAARSAEAGVDVARADLLPQVSLTGDFTRALDTQSTSSELNNLGAAVVLSVPIYEAGAVYSRVRQQKHVAGQRRIEIDQIRRDATESATQAWEALQASQARSASLVTQIRSAEIALEGVEREAQVGSRTVLDVLNAEQELLNARVSLVRSQRDEAVAAFQLKAAIGTLTAQALALPVDVYDPTAHYQDVRGRWIGTDVEPVPGADYGSRAQ